MGVATLGTYYGPAGTTVKIATKNLPRDMQSQISMGAMRDGFEVIKTGYTDMSGRFNGRDTVEVTIPDWVRNDRPYLVMVTDLQYNPFAPAEMVHPTDARGLIVRRGVIKQEAQGGCPTLTGEAGELYFLMGDLAGAHVGDRARVQGRPVQNSRCGTGTTIEVSSTRLVAQR
jgi:hypothetical protein